MADLQFTPPSEAILNLLKHSPRDVEIAKAVGDSEIKFQILWYLTRSSVLDRMTLLRIRMRVRSKTWRDRDVDQAVLDLLQGGILRVFPGGSYSIGDGVESFIKRYHLCYKGYKQWEWALARSRRVG